MEMESSVIYYMAFRPVEEEENFDSNKIAKKKKKNKTKNKKKQDGNEDLLNIFNSEDMNKNTLSFFDHFRPKDTQTTKESKTNIKERKLICIHVDCKPVGSLELKVDPLRKVEDIMVDISEKVWDKFSTRINVRGLEFTGDGSVHKGIPIDYPIGELLDDQDEVIVDYTTPVQAASTLSFRNTPVSDDEIEDNEPEEGNETIYVCPFRFSGPSANRELKLHLANVRNLPSQLPKSHGGETIQCPLYFFNEIDASKHIQDSHRDSEERENVDLRPFWERSEEDEQYVKKSAQLIEREMSKNRRMEMDRLKKKEKKRKIKANKLKAKEEKLKMEQEREAQMQKDLEEKKKQKILQEQRRRQLEIKKGVKSILMEHILRKVENSIEQRRIQSKKKPKKPKKKKNTVQLEIQEEEVETQRTQVETSIPRTIKTKNTKFYPLGRTKRLHCEIEEYVNIMKQVVDKQEIFVDKMIGRVKEIVSELWPNARVQVYGSHATGLMIPSSDLDLVVINAHSEDDRHPIMTLSNAIKRCEWVRTLQCIETARIPVIKLMSKEEKIPTDITFEIKNLPAFFSPEGGLVHHEGLASCELILGFISKFPSLVSLALVLKQMLRERNLHNAYTGGLSSYCLVLMIISFLQLTDDVNEKNLGMLLLDFLELYGKNFDFATQGISISGNGHHFSLEDGKQSGSLVIVDPFNPTNNVGQQIVGMTRIKMILEDVHKILVSPFYSSFTPANPILHRVLNPEHVHQKN